MGIESDQLVFDYLSRVGDLAQRHQLPSATRMRLVSELRGEIDRSRAKSPVDSPAAVRRILARLGTPDEVVAAASADAPGGTAESRPAAVPVQRADDAEPRPKGLRRVVPRPRSAEPGPADTSRNAPSPPHLAGAHELGDSATRPDWWRVEGGSGGGFGLGDAVPGFVGGVEIPELLKPPPGDTPKPEAGRDNPAPEPAAAVEAAPAAEETAAPRRRLPRLTGRRNPLLLVAALLLVVGAVLGSWPALGLGWLIAWASRRLSPVESKWAVMGMPGVAAAAGVVWLWGRTDGRWGDPIAQGHMNDAVAQTWPWVVRGAALASALYLVWRSQRAK
ncbi:hypothetical protein ACFOZ0_07330 [Streptomyces yaanensis]|uniref:Integral membrane protein n=1 Tax=Streptomyces yaanensis TaxID=1142239 RepID=A0ABV7S826_9ACTN|nr:hypothetical protein [Streptomyces sp. CGMCC 4.7035]WNC02598.1 hypothetical protein Q2K21_33600 [Streptomyces sp. CGMCC 4.7035]